MIASPLPTLEPVTRDDAPLLVGTDLRKRFGQTDALRGLDFALSRGEIVAIMGPSGSGKSTLLHCLAGIIVPDGGQVTFAGRSVAAMGDAERSRLRRTSFGFVFQVLCALETR